MQRPVNRGQTEQRNGGLSGQITLRDSRAAAPAHGWRRIRPQQRRFTQSTELGYLNPDRSVTGLAPSPMATTGGEVDGEPFDARVDLDGTDPHVEPVRDRHDRSPAIAWHLTLSGRFNRTTVDNDDLITPGGGPGSLDGDHVFSRFNPAAGVTYDPSSHLNLYAGYSEGSRAATSIELGCADPEQPCKLPNAMAGDPPLDQVVTRTWEAGVRGERGRRQLERGLFPRRQR